MESRPKTLKGKTTKIPTGYGNLYITINKLDNKPIEIFLTISKSGQSLMAKAEAIGRLSTLALSKGATVEELIEQLRDISGEKPNYYKDKLIKSIPDALAQVLWEEYKKE